MKKLGNCNNTNICPKSGVKIHETYNNNNNNNNTNYVG